MGSGALRRFSGIISALGDLPAPVTELILMAAILRVTPGLLALDLPEC
jgi:hypothetical protein